MGFEPVIYLIALAAVIGVAAWVARGRVVVQRVPARWESIRTLVALLNRVARSARLGEQELFQCRLALDEACANIIEHSYAGNLDGEIEVSMRAAPGLCEICLTDFGAPFDPAQVRQLQGSVTLDDLRPGGLGLHLMRMVMDEVHYDSGPFGNSVVMVKRRQPSRP